jgi:hypothetical protein
VIHQGPNGHETFDPHSALQQEAICVYWCPFAVENKPLMNADNQKFSIRNKNGLQKFDFSLAK